MSWIYVWTVSYFVKEKSLANKIFTVEHNLSTSVNSLSFRMKNSKIKVQFINIFFMGNITMKCKKKYLNKNTRKNLLKVVNFSIFKMLINVFAILDTNSNFHV